MAHEPIFTAHILYRYVVLTFDEMKIKEGLVYNKHTGQVVGFTNLGQVNADLEALERRVNVMADDPTMATHMLSFMVRGNTKTICKNVQVECQLHVLQLSSLLQVCSHHYSIPMLTSRLPA